MKACEVMRLISGALQDMEPDAEKRWSWERDPDRVCLLDFLNDAIRSIVMQRPDALAVTDVIRLEPGMRQALPCPKRHGARHEATILIELVRNMGCDGQSPGKAILPVNTDILMSWHCCMEEGTVIDNYAYDRMTNPRFYMVYPAVPQCGSVYVQATYGAEPCQVCEPEHYICLPERYGPVIMHHVLAAIFGGDSEISHLEKAAWHLQRYNSLMGIKLAVDHGWPKAKSSPAPGAGQ